MAHTEPLSAEQAALRRRARRRLVGAIALTLTAVVVLPMLFSPEPRPLGPEVDIRIPDPASPFPGGPVAVPQAPQQPAPAATPPTDAGQSAERNLPEAPAVVSAPPPKPQAKSPVRQGQETTASAGAAAAVTPAGDKAQAPPPVSETFAARGYFLQLGAFGSEANARQLLERARAAGFDAFVQTQGGQVRVRVGPFAARSEALQMQARLRERGFAPILLGP
ncbi:MAG: SPOR domain-containing protein [Thiobacillaceae bacterium]|nr:SPOR domain-containing protein [Thiobacillaceae bacterium]MDW8323152.1 SPOR domain-containing protein [Burkholderiales bacterium]